MTRSEALDAVGLLPQNASYEDVYSVINKIYDDFKNELAIAFDEGQAEAFEEMDEEIRKAYLEGSNDCFKALKETGKFK